MDDGAGAQVPMDVVETSRKRNTKHAGHQQNDATRGGEQPDRGSLADAGMHEAMGDAGAIGADAMALAEAYSPARFQRRTGAFGLSAGVLRSRTCSFLSPICFALFQLQALNTKPDRMAELLKQRRHHLVFLTALWHGRRSSEVDAFSFNIRERRRRGTSRA